MANRPSPITGWLRQLMAEELPNYRQDSEVDVDGFFEAVYQRAVEDVVMWEEFERSKGRSGLRALLHQFLNAREQKDYQAMVSVEDGQTRFELPEWDVVERDHFTWVDDEGKRHKANTGRASIEELNAGIQTRMKEEEDHAQYTRMLEGLLEEMLKRGVGTVWDLYHAA